MTESPAIVAKFQKQNPVFVALNKFAIPIGGNVVPRVLETWTLELGTGVVAAMKAEEVKAEEVKEKKITDTHPQTTPPIEFDFCEVCYSKPKVSELLATVRDRYVSSHG